MSAIKLSENQERRITRYLRDVGEHLGDLSLRERESALARLNARIELELAKFRNGLEDADLLKVLQRCGNPAEQAARLMPSRPVPPDTFVCWSDRVWLGVCAGIARKLDVDATIVRIVAVLIGIVFPLVPLLLIAYVAVFLWDYYTTEEGVFDPIEPLKLVKALAGVLAVALALHYGTRALLIFISHAYQMVMVQPLVLERRWGWITSDAGSWLFWVLAIGLPLAALSALPVPKAWAGTLKKTVQAGLALYAVWLCFGIACVIAGVILQSVDEFTGTAGTDALFSLIR